MRYTDFLGLYSDIVITARAEELHCAALRMEQLDLFSKLHSISYAISLNDQKSFSFVIRSVEVAL